MVCCGQVAAFGSPFGDPGSNQLETPMTVQDQAADFTSPRLDQTASTKSNPAKTDALAAIRPGKTSDPLRQPRALLHQSAAFLCVCLGIAVLLWGWSTTYKVTPNYVMNTVTGVICYGNACFRTVRAE
jgi:hypothetical protein